MPATSPDKLDLTAIVQLSECQDRMMGKTLRADAALDKHLLAKIRCLGKGVEPTV